MEFCTFSVFTNYMFILYVWWVDVLVVVVAWGWECCDRELSDRDTDTDHSSTTAEGSGVEASPAAPLVQMLGEGGGGGGGLERRVASILQGYHVAAGQQATIM